MKLVISPNPILQQRAEDWTFDNLEEATTLENEMIALMKTFRGIGLAANQVGLLKRVLAIQLQKHPDRLEPFAMFNPSILSVSDEMQQGQEGCLSFPELWLDIKRPRQVDVEYFDKYKNKCTITLRDIDARCFLHELDHLDGICFTEKVPPMRLLLALKQQRNKNGRTKR